MTHATDANTASNHSPEPWDCHRDRDGCDDVLFIEAADGTDIVQIRFWDEPDTDHAAASEANARRILAAVNACKGLTTEALEQSTIGRLLQSIPALLDAAAGLDAAIDGVTDQFDTERAELDAAWKNLHTAFAQATGTEATASAEVDIHEVLAGRHQIAAIWSVEDVQEVRPDLTDEQAWQVLQQVEHYHDCNDGITWTTLEILAEVLFGFAAETDAA